MASTKHNARAREQEHFRETMLARHSAKLGPLLASPGFSVPDSLAAEQATGALIASWRWESLKPEGMSVLDMTCGLGMDTFHAAMNGARVTAIELNPQRAAAAAANARALGLEGRVEIVNADSIEWLKAHPEEHFDIIFIDPSRRAEGSGKRLFGLADCLPDVTAALPLLLGACDKLIVKASPMLDVTNTLRELGGRADIALIGTPRECKELTATLPGSGQLSVVNLMADGTCATYSPTYDELPEVEYAAPEAGMLLMEPYPAMMKAGCDAWLCATYGMRKIARDTNLYLLPAGADASLFKSLLPGKVWRIDSVRETGSAAWRELRGINAQTAVRGGFPMTADALRAKLKAGESDERRIYGLRDASARKLLVTCSLPSSGAI